MIVWPPPSAPRYTPATSASITVAASWQMRARTVSRSSDSLSDFAARVSACCWRTCITCSSIVRRRSRAAAAASAKAVATSASTLAESFEAVQEQDAIEAVGRAQQEQQAVARLRLLDKRRDGAHPGRVGAHQAQTPVEHLRQRREVVERPGRADAGAGRAPRTRRRRPGSWASRTAPAAPKHSQASPTMVAWMSSARALGGGGEQPRHRHQRADGFLRPARASVLNRSPDPTVYTAPPPRRGGRVAEGTRLLSE